MKSPLNTPLLVYCTILGTAVAVATVSRAVGDPEVKAFDEIDVHRINVREEDGTLRMVISNTESFPGMIIRGEEYPHPNRRQAGILFYNEEATEMGGLGFSGRKEDGTVSAGAQLAFDQYEQDQVIRIAHEEHDGVRKAGLIVADRPDRSFDPEAITAVQAMPDGPERKAEMARLREIYSGVDRLFVGKTNDRASTVNLKDAEGRTRVLLQVTADGEASIQFVDENGKITRSITPESVAKGS